MCIIFDLDGTLLNTLTDLAIAVNFALKSNRLPELPEESMKLLVGNGVRPLTDRAVAIAWQQWNTEQQEHYLMLTVAAASEDETFTEELITVEYATAYKQIAAAKIPLQLADAVFADFKEYYAQHSMDETKAYPGIMELLHALKNNGRNLAVMSNKADTMTQAIVKHYFGDNLFSAVLGMREDLAPKPDPAGALYLADKLEVKPGEVIFVGDAMTDMRTAVSAGMTAIGVSWGFRSVEELLDNGAARIIDRPADLEELLPALK